MTPPTGCAHRPGSSSQPHPTGSTHLHGSRWQTACLRERRHVHVRCRLTSLGGVRVRALSFISLIIGWLTVDIDKRSNLVLVVRQTTDLSHWYRGVSGDGQPVDHYQKKEGTGFFTGLVFVNLLDFFSYWSPYPWQQLRSSSAAPLMRLFLQNTAPQKIALISLCANSGVTIHRLKGLLWQSHRCRCDSACDTAAESFRSTRTVPARRRATCSGAPAPANTETHTQTQVKNNLSQLACRCSNSFFLIKSIFFLISQQNRKDLQC